METPRYTREMIVTARDDGRFDVTTLGYGGILGNRWNVFHHICVRTFPVAAIARVSGRNDYRVRVRIETSTFDNNCQ